MFEKLISYEQLQSKFPSELLDIFLKLQKETVEAVFNKEFSIDDTCRNEMAKQLVDIQSNSSQRLLETFHNLSTPMTMPSSPIEHSAGIESPSEMMTEFVNLMGNAPVSAATIKIRHCPACGSEVPEGEAFCGECGNRMV